MGITKKRKLSTKNDEMYSQLSQAVQNRNINAISSSLISYPESISEELDDRQIIFLLFRNANGDLKLQTSIISILKLLLDVGADVNITNSVGQTVLHLAVKNRMTQVIDYLTSRGGNWKVRDKHGNSILHFLIESEAKKFKDYIKIVKTVERQAFEQRSTDFIEWIISNDAVDVECRNRKEETALHLATKYNLLHAIPILLKHTIYTTIYNYLGMTAFQIFIDSAVCGKRHSTHENIPPVPMSNYEPKYVVNICEKFLKSGFSVDVVDIMNTPLHYVLRYRRRNFAKLMLKHVKNIDARDESGNTALNIIASYTQDESAEDDERMARFLLYKGADVYVLNNNKSSPLISTVSNLKLPLLKIIEERGADFGRLYKTGNLLHYFLETKAETDVTTYLAIFDLLINQGCDPNAKNHLGVTPLHLACKYGKIEIVERLIGCNANVGSRDYTHWYSPLHVAVEHHQTHLLEVLVRNGADVNAKTKSGQTALCLLPNEDDVKQLIKLGARLDVVDRNGFLPLQVAIRNKNSRAIKCLLELGADVNDNAYVLDLNEIVEFPAMTEHLIKLKAAGLSIDEKLRRVFSYLGTSAMYKNCIEEVGKLKSYKFNDSKSLYDFLHMNRNSTCSYVDNERLKRLIGSSKFVRYFPIYHVLISSRYYMAVERRKLLGLAKNAWLELTNIRLADVCVYEILSHFSNVDLRTMSKKKKNKERKTRMKIV